MKSGLKTFPLAVDNSDALKLIEAEYGIKGFAVIIKLHQCIFSKGYYTAWGQDERLLFIDDYRLSSVGCAGVTDIAECALRRGVFDSRLYEKYGILTNRAIQETFLKANERTTVVKLDKNYVLPEVCTFIEIASKKGKYVNIIWKNADIFTQKKEEEKKEEEKKEECIAHTHTKKVFGSYKNVWINEDDYKNLQFNFPQDQIDKAIERMSEYCSTNEKEYPNPIPYLNRWIRENIANGTSVKPATGKQKNQPYQDKVYSEEEKAAIERQLEEEIK